MLTLIKNAHVFAPASIGKTDLLYSSGAIERIGSFDEAAAAKLGLEMEVIDLRGRYLIPGIIDPHAHLLGGSGEHGGFSTQTPEISLTELTQAGITTVVGTLGTDTTMKTMPGLLAKAKGLNEEGLSAYIYSGGYSTPPTTIMGGIRQDIMFIEEVIGVGEIAISDERSHEPQEAELARIASEAFIGGMLSGKAGVTHFHVGPSKCRLKGLTDVLNSRAEVRAEWFYPTHINRSTELVRDSVELTKRGSYVDMDTVDQDLYQWLKVYLEFGGDLKKLTVSSDAALTSPSNLHEEIRFCVREGGMSLETLIPLVTVNPASVLKLKNKGQIRVGFEPSFVAMDPDTFTITDVISKGKIMIRDKNIVTRERFAAHSNRVISIHCERKKDEGRCC